MLDPDEESEAGAHGAHRRRLRSGGGVVSRHPDDAVLTHLESIWPKARCSCGHHFGQHEATGIDSGDMYCRACPCEDYDGPGLPEVDE